MTANLICFDISFLDIYHLDISRIPPQWKESLVKEYNSNNRSFIYWILSRYEDSPSPGTRSAALGAGSAVVNCDLLELENLTVVYNITLRQIKLFLTITKETCLLVHSSKNTQLVSGQGPGRGPQLVWPGSCVWTPNICSHSYLHNFHLHMCPTQGPLAKWQAHAPVIERCWQGATWLCPSRLQLCAGAGSWVHISVWWGGSTNCSWVVLHRFHNRFPQSWRMPLLGLSAGWKCWSLPLSHI